MNAGSKSLSFLHLSDFHQGLAGQGWLWPNVREKIYEDLARLHDHAGPWDAVFFTGDLAQQAGLKEYERLEAELQRLFDLLRSLGSSPVLLAVPGNHDLTRPDPRSPELDEQALQVWYEQFQTVRDYEKSGLGADRQSAAYHDYLDKQSGQVARFQSLRARLAERELQPGAGNYGYTSVRSDITEFFEWREGTGTAASATAPFWELSRGEEKISLVDWSNADVEPTIPRVTDRRHDWVNGRLRAKDQIVRFTLHPAGAPQTLFHVTEDAALPSSASKARRSRRAGIA